METHHAPSSALARLADTYGVDTPHPAPGAATALCSCMLDAPSPRDGVPHFRKIMICVATALIMTSIVCTLA
ncbi:hypothetical protein V2W30_38995 [Streptomyces sp. Q6]|uniref:Uncharacterized protein n=1 Tax=Streptomyces citrinus TaxID=3118173 RepID=A0ACD5ANI4_9ACTN